MKTFHTTRHLPASASEIFQAFQSPERFARWWGPKGFINTFHHFDFQKNGHWSFTMHGPDGKNYPNECVFNEIQFPFLIQIQHLSEPHFVLKIELQETPHGTDLSWTQIFENSKIADQIAEIVIPSNEQNLDRLNSEILQAGSKIDAIGKTSLLVAAMRARETTLTPPDQRLFQDPYAESLAGTLGSDLLYKALRDSGDQPAIAVRTYYMDQKILKAIQDGVQQIVVLAAGMDTRAYRLSLPKNIHIFELDRTEVLNYKNVILQGHEPTCHRHVLRVDLRHDWKNDLLQSGFQSSKRTLWLVEGLLMYLEEPHVLNLFSKINSLAQPRDILLCDIFTKALLEAPHMKKQLQFLQQMGASWHFGIQNEPEEFMRDLGWQAQATQPGEVVPSRWPFPVTPRNIPNVPRSYFLEAMKSV